MQTAYESRPVLMRDVWTPPAPAGWRIKRIGIRYAGDDVDDALFDAASEAAMKALPPAGSPNAGLGFLGVHEGRGFDQVFLCWWENDNELQLRVFIADKEAPESLRPAPEGWCAACTWDLKVMAYERDAWVRHMLRAGGGGPEAYLDARIAEHL